MSKYNGWTNRETWLVNLWIDNTPADHEHYRAQAEFYLRETDGDQQQAAYELAEEMKAEHEYGIDNIDRSQISGMYRDLLSYALAGVNWQEIAEHLIEDAADAEE